MVKPVELGGDVVAGASALAGLFLVYLGNVATAFASYDKPAQAVVRKDFQARARLATAGIILAIISAGLALVGKWGDHDGIVSGAIILLLVSLILMALIAIIAVRDIR